MKTQTVLNATWLICGALLVLECSCQREDPKPDPTPVVAPGSTHTETDEATPDAMPTLQCPPEVKGAQLILIPWADGGGYCIDQREVINSEYKEFILAKGDDISGQPKGCSKNTQFVPDLYDDTDPTDDEEHFSYECPLSKWTLDTKPDAAVGCVDICDAWSYCNWAGKRLCGIRGADPGELNEMSDENIEPSAYSPDNEWFNVCTQGGKTKFPYGDSYEPARCLDKTAWSASDYHQPATADVSSSECHGSSKPYDQVYHINGNVEEYTNNCHESGGGCWSQGGVYTVSEPSEFACDTSGGTTSRTSVYPGIGFRCCADAVAVGP